MAGQGRTGSIWSAPAWRLRLAGLLLVAFGPVVLNALHHVIENPWARGCLVFPWLTAHAARSVPADANAARPALAWAFLVGGLVFELVALGGDALRIARLGAAVAAAGIFWSAGWLRAGVALLVLFWLPLPSQLVKLGSPLLERALGRVFTLFPGVELEAILADTALHVGEAVLPMSPLDGGLALVFGLAGVGWFLAARVGAAPTAALASAARGAAAGGAIQVAVLALAVSAVALGVAPAAARDGLDHAGWLIVVAIGCVAAVRPERLVPGRVRAAGEGGVR